MSKGYIASTEKIRDRLLISEWELGRKVAAARRRASARALRCSAGAARLAPRGWPQLAAALTLRAVQRRRRAKHSPPAASPPWNRRGVAAFELHCAAERVDLPFEVLTHLYDSPDDLDVIADPHLRMQAREEGHAAAKASLVGRRAVGGRAVGGWAVGLTPPTRVAHALQARASIRVASDEEYGKVRRRSEGGRARRQAACWLAGRTTVLLLPTAADWLLAGCC